MDRARGRRWKQYCDRMGSVQGAGTIAGAQSRYMTTTATPEQLLALAILERAFMDLTDRGERGAAWAFLRSAWAAYLWDNLDFDAPLPLVLEHLSGVMPGGWAV